MKRFLSVLLVLSMLTVSAACTPKQAIRYDDTYYENVVLPKAVSPVKTDMRLPGMAEDVILLPDVSEYDPEKIDVGFAALFNVTGDEILYLKQPTDRIYPASMTKIMTALLVIENCRNFDEKIRVTDVMNTGLTENSSSAGLQIGCFYSVTDLLYGLLIPSGNDAANVLADYIAGSVPAFVEMMNEKALSLGMFDTHFANPHGLHDRNHYTTVYDLYLLMKECIKYPMFIGAAGSQVATINGIREDGSTFSQSYKSTNSFLLGYTVPPEGIRVRAAKTGYTSQAGRCLILAVQDSEKNFYIAVVAKADTYDNLYLHMNELLAIITEEEK